MLPSEHTASIPPLGFAPARQDIEVDVSGYSADCGVAVRVNDGVLHVAWTMAESEFGRVAFDLRPGRPLVRSLWIGGPLRCLLAATKSRRP